MNNKNDTWNTEPYSLSVNVISCIIVLYFLFQTKHLRSFLLVFGLLMFDIMHLFSRWVHITDGLQITITYVIAMTTNFLFLYNIYKYTGKTPSNLLLGTIFAIFVTDIYFFFNMSFVYYLFTQILLLFVIIFYYFSAVKKLMDPFFYLFVGLILTTYAVFLNETYNNKKIIEIYPEFPYHLVIEILVTISNHLFVSSFSQL